MKDAELRDLVSAVQSLLRPHLERSEPLRQVALHLGRWLVAEAGRSLTQDEAGSPDPGPDLADLEDLADLAEREDFPERPETAASDRDGERPESDDRAPEPEIHVTVPLKVGGARAHVPVRVTRGEIAGGTVPAPVAAERNPAPVASARSDDGVGAAGAPAEEPIDLALIERRSRLKAESCRLLIDRRAARADPVAEPPLLERMNDMLAEAKATPRCFLWAFYREREPPVDAVLELIARCYEVMADAVPLAQRVEECGDQARDADVEAALALCAEANCALRVAMEQTWLGSADADQDDFHRWIRKETATRGIYVPQFLKLEDRADPADADELARRVTALRDEFGRHARRLKQIRAGFSKLRYHLDLLAGEREGAFDDYHGERIVEAMGTLDDLGVPHTDRRFGELMDPAIAGSIASRDGSPFVDRVLESVRDRYASAASAAAPAAERSDERSERVLEVRDLLAGGTVVMIGGEPRAEAADRIRDAFDLADVRWVRLTEHGTGQPMIAPITRPDTLLVLVLVKLAGHLHVEEACACAKEAGKPLVMLKAGYNPEQIAEAVIQQASEQIRSLTASRAR